jgi:hypothetical protein
MKFGKRSHLQSRPEALLSILPANVFVPIEEETCLIETFCSMYRSILSKCISLRICSNTIEKLDVCDQEISCHIVTQSATSNRVLDLDLELLESKL